MNAVGHHVADEEFVLRFVEGVDDAFHRLAFVACPFFPVIEDETAFGEWRKIGAAFDDEDEAGCTECGESGAAGDGGGGRHEKSVAVLSIVLRFLRCCVSRERER